MFVVAMAIALGNYSRRIPIDAPGETGLRMDSSDVEDQTSQP
jgi:hypothetical protein